MAQRGRGYYNLAVQGRRQAGSAFKPFVLATALDEGIERVRLLLRALGRSPSATGRRDNYDGARGARERPQRHDLLDQHGVRPDHRGRRCDRRRRHGPHDRDRQPAGRGPDPDPGHLLGLAPRDDARPTRPSPLGASGAAPTRRSWSWSTAMGEEHPADHHQRQPGDGRDLAGASHRRSSRTWCSYGTGTRAAARRATTPPARPGTTNSHRDAWFCGYTSEVATCVWMGYTPAAEPHGQTSTASASRAARSRRRSGTGSWRRCRSPETDLEGGEVGPPARARHHAFADPHTGRRRARPTRPRPTDPTVPPSPPARTVASCPSVERTGQLPRPARGRGGHYEAWYLTFADPAAGPATGSATRCTPPTGAGAPEARLWFARFDHARPGADPRPEPRPPHRRVRHRGLGVRDPDRRRRAPVGPPHRRPSRAAATPSRGTSTSTTGGPTYRMLPDALYRGSLAPSKPFAPNPDTRFTGTIEVDGETRLARQRPRAAGPRVRLAARRAVGVGPVQRLRRRARTRSWSRWCAQGRRGPLLTPHTTFVGAAPRRGVASVPQGISRHEGLGARRLAASPSRAAAPAGRVDPRRAGAADPRATTPTPTGPPRYCHNSEVSSARLTLMERRAGGFEEVAELSLGRHRPRRVGRA